MNESQKPDLEDCGLSPSDPAFLDDTTIDEVPESRCFSVPRVHLAAYHGQTVEQRRPLCGPYQLVHHLGDGSMGEVYLGKSRGAIQDWVAVKRMTPGYRTNRRMRERFDREIATMRILSHRSIVSILEAGETEDGPWLAMSYIAGPEGYRDSNWPSDLSVESPLSLGRRIDEFGTMGSTQVVRLGIQLCNVLGHMHDKNIFHRDIKPLNILLDKDENPVLVDFGIAIESSEATASWNNSLVGSRKYMAPEYRVGGQFDPRAEVYALGATLSFALSGDTTTYTTKSTGDESLENILAKSVAEDPVSRFADGCDMREALERLSRQDNATKNSSGIAIRRRRPASKKKSAGDGNVRIRRKR